MEKIKKILTSKQFNQFETAYNLDRLSHAYLISGEDQTSNQNFALAMVLKLICQQSKVCFSCMGCKKILAGFHPDVLVYPKGKNFVVADSEDILANVNIKPMESKYKIFLIKDIDMATVQAQNKLLKTIEESPNNVVFIFTAQKLHAVLDTIKSRTQILVIGNFEENILVNHKDYPLVYDMILNMQSSKQTLKFAVKFAEKSGFADRLLLLGQVLEKMLFDKTFGGQLSDIGKSYHSKAIAEIVELITIAKRQFEANVSTNLIADNLLLKILEVRYKWSKK